MHRKQGTLEDAMKFRGETSEITGKFPEETGIYTVFTNWIPADWPVYSVVAPPFPRSLREGGISDAEKFNPTSQFGQTLTQSLSTWTFA